MKQNQEITPALTPETARPDMSHIEHMKEDTLAEIIAKKNAFNDLILTFDNLITQIPEQNNEAGESKQQEDLAGQESLDGRDLMLLRRDMDHARDEMVRLGDKEELTLKKAA
jgi:hypothetical protein